jgi:hypothetical protein
MVVPTGVVFVIGPIERFRPEGFNRRIRPTTSIDDGTSKAIG